MIKFVIAIWLGLMSVASAQLAGGLMFPGPGTVASAGGGGGCTGTINLSTGCVQPMLR